MKISSTFTSFLLAALLAGCTSETEQEVDRPIGGGGTDNDDNRQEVTLILKNDLALRSTPSTKSGEAPGVATKADTPIATADENVISSLDVYVFGSPTETGDYTFQERFAYRADANATLPAGVTALKLTAAGGDTKETTGLLKLKKGLFVKLYCIANATSLVGPDGNKVADTSFKPLVFTEDGTGVQTLGEPTESGFISYHTPLLDATEPTDVLTTPLAMSGAYITPLDLTDFESSARLQASFKLTRLAARFDIINLAETSKFTIESVSMGKGRRGATFFPIRVYGDTPTAKDGELITYPERAFDGTGANLGIQTGAFYSYPSPKEDEAYLILKGTYQVNKTESKEVTYQVPFRTSSASGDGSYLEINNNHRYTLAITDADAYHLDFTLNVADWADDGTINDYTPGNDTGKIEVTVPDGDTETQYDADNHIVTMSLNAGTTFDMMMEKTSPMLPAITKTYAGGLSAQEYDWLEITQPAASASAPLTKTDEGDAPSGDDNTITDGYKYTFALKDGYTKNRYPRAIVRFTNLTNGNEIVLFVDALEAPRALTTIQDGKNNHNTFDAETLEAGVYRLTDSNLRIKFFCSTAVELAECPAWLTSKQLSENGGEYLYSFTLNDVAATPTDDKGMIVFKNIKYPDKTLEVTVNLLAPDITPGFADLGGEGNVFTPADDTNPANVTLKSVANNTFKISTTSLEGVTLSVDFNGGSTWFRHNGEVTTKAGTVPNEITFSLLIDSVRTAEKATVTLKNKTQGGGEDFVFTVTPDFQLPVEAKASVQQGANNHNTFDASTLKANVYRLTNSNLRIKLFCWTGVEVASCPDWLTPQLVSDAKGEALYSFTLNNVSATPAEDKGTITFKNAKCPEKTLDVSVQLIKADIVPNFNNLGGSSNTFAPASGSTPANVTMRIAENNTFNFTSTSLEGIKIDMNFDGGPAWLSHNGEVATKAGTEPNTITFSLIKDKLLGAKKTTITLKNKVPGGGEDYVFTVTPDFVVPQLTSAATMALNAGTDKTVPSIKITGNCFGGSKIVANESPAWLTYETTSTTANTFSYTVKLVPEGMANFPTSLPGNQTITVASAINPDKKTTVTVSFTDKGWVEESINEDESYGNTPKSVYRVGTAGKTLTITAYSMFATPTITTAYTSGYGSNNTTWLPQPTAPKTSGYGNNRKKFTYQIVVPATSGNDAAYQLYQGTISIKQSTTELKKITLWRGASNVGYPVSNGYYSAVKRGDIWWAPFNLGATEVAKNATSLSSIGNLYQWGRNKATTYGSTAKKDGPVSADTSDEFITGTSASNYDWLSPKNDNLWGKPKTAKDPCPTGWRVPTSDELGKWGSGSFSGGLLTITGQNGINLVLPAAGFRSYSSGASYNQGSYGYYWSSSVSGTSARNVYFLSGTVYGGAYYRAYGFSVRCVQE